LGFTLLAISLLPAIVDAAEPAEQLIQVNGRIVDTEGRPIRDVACFWIWSQTSRWGAPINELFSETRTDAAGRFTLHEHAEAARDPDRRHLGILWFYAEGYAVTSRHVQDQFLPDFSTPRKVDIVLRPARKFAYRVIGPDNHPRLGELIEPVHLTAGMHSIAPPRPVRDLLSGTTDENGLFSVNSVAAEDGMLVRVVSEQFGIFTQLPNLARGIPPEVTIRLLPVGTVEGVVKGPGLELLANRAIQIATIRDQDPRLPACGMAETTIDAQGRFRVPTIAAGEITIHIDTPPGLILEPKAPPVWGEVIPGQTTKISVAVLRTVPLQGRIRMPDGSEPVAEGAVRVIARGPNRERWTPIGPGGRFLVDIVPGTFELEAELRTLNDIPVVRKSLLARTEVTVKEDAERPESPDLVLPKLRLVEGRALTANGQPLAGQLIYAGFGRGIETQVKTDAEGQFRFYVGAEVAGGSYSLVRDARTFATLEKTENPLTVRLLPAPGSINP